MPGPIATKVLRDISKFSKRKVINFSEIKKSKLKMEASLHKNKMESLSQLDPLYAIYVDAQHSVVDFFEIFSQLPHGQKFCDKHEGAEDTYMPSYPPMSPVTNSFFTNWFALDMTIGVKKESIISIMIDLYRQIKASNDLISLLTIMQASYNGIYVHEGADGEVIYLKEVYTNERHKVYVPSGYRGQEGETWLVRLLPSPFESYIDYKVAFSTPYIVMNIPLAALGTKVSASTYKESEWTDFIERNLFKIRAKTTKQRYYQFMKYGLDKHYWLEYVFVSFVSFTDKMILLSGFPDKPETLAHHSHNTNITHA